MERLEEVTVKSRQATALYASGGGRNRRACIGSVTLPWSLSLAGAEVTVKSRCQRSVEHPAKARDRHRIAAHET